ncbi:MAG: 4-hydroxy-tetrahydrodipicolinate synthase [Bdellovibrionaceae bacterium]|nr:4-hydroxy-tetrahydrodipicolinate synthase [Pseudobdellovibrionaceae bacterium]MDW8189469.1 4-hydroxy-tetrahydrodipicolinate synthase [Pseudobdellovibrionaceae bacterium]
MKDLEGVTTALVTPFWQGQIDKDSFVRLLQSQMAAGITSFVLGGTTGESPTLTQQELETLFRLAREVGGNRISITMGIGSNSTAITIERAKWAEKLGADSLLVVVPYYNKPPQRGLFQHFMAVAEATQLPIILYNVPSRTVTSLALETIVELSKHPRIVAIKEASGNIEFGEKIVKQCQERLILLSGDDESAHKLRAVGSRGVISVASHVLPKPFLGGYQDQKMSLIQALYVETNPIPVKMALYLMGVVRSPECRLPLVQASEETKRLLRTELEKEGLIP